MSIDIYVKGIVAVEEGRRISGYVAYLKSPNGFKKNVAVFEDLDTSMIELKGIYDSLNLVNKNVSVTVYCSEYIVSCINNNLLEKWEAQNWERINNYKKTKTVLSNKIYWKGILESIKRIDNIDFKNIKEVNTSSLKLKKSLYDAIRLYNS